MKISYKVIPLRPFPGEIYLFKDLDHIKAKYYAMTKTLYHYSEDPIGGQFVRVVGKRERDAVWLVYGRSSHVLAHEFAHILLEVFRTIDSDPADGKGEPFCYMLSQLMLEAK